jgi:hypothetical protein
MGWPTEESLFKCWLGQEMFLFSTVSTLALGFPQPPIQWVMDTTSLGAKMLGREADHSLLSCAVVKNTWSYKSMSPSIFMAW